MGLAKEEKERLHDFLLQQVSEGHEDPAAPAEKLFGLSRRAVRKHLERMAEAGRLVARGGRGRRRYDLPPFLVSHLEVDPRKEGPARVWLDWLGPGLSEASPETRDVFWYALEEFLGNAEEHLPAEAARVQLTLIRTTAYDQLVIEDQGPGLFQDTATGEESSPDPAEAALAFAAGERLSGLQEIGWLATRVRLQANGIALLRTGPRGAWRLGSGGDQAGTRIEMRVATGPCAGLAPLADAQVEGTRKAWLPASWVGKEAEALQASPERTQRLLEAASGLDELTVDFRGIEELADDLAATLFGKDRPSSGPRIRRSGAAPAVEGTIREALLSARG